MDDFGRLNVQPLPWTFLDASTNSASVAAEPWPPIDISIATADTLPAPALALAEFFPPAWTDWIARAAAAKGAPVDYVAMALLATAGGLIGNARWTRP